MTLYQRVEVSTGAHVGDPALQVISQVELDGPLTVQGVRYMQSTAPPLLTAEQAAALLA